MRQSLHPFSRTSGFIFSSLRSCVQEQRAAASFSSQLPSCCPCSFRQVYPSYSPPCLKACFGQAWLLLRVKPTYYSTECTMAHIRRKPARQFFLYAPSCILYSGENRCCSLHRKKGFLQLAVDQFISRVVRVKAVRIIALAKHRDFRLDT